MDFGLNGKTALVLGADEAAGLACAKALAAEGAGVILAGRDAQKLAQAGKALSAKTYALPAEVGSGKALAARILAAHRVIDVIAVTFAPAPRIRIADLGLEATALTDAWEEVANLGAVYGELLGGMKARGWGRLVYIGPIESKAFAAPDSTLDRITGLGMLGLQKTLGGEFGDAGVTANSVLYDATLEPREATLASVGAAAAYLASQPAAYLTGVTMTVHGASPQGVF